MDIDIYPSDHLCIDHPNYFEKTVPALSSIQVHAKWFSACPASGGTGGFIFVNIDFVADGHTFNEHLQLTKEDPDKHKHICITMSDGAPGLDFCG